MKITIIPEVLAPTIHGSDVDTIYTYQIFQEYTELRCITNFVKSKNGKSSKIKEIYHASIHKSPPLVPKEVEQQLKNYMTGKAVLSLTQ